MEILEVMNFFEPEFNLFLTVATPAAALPATTGPTQQAVSPVPVPLHMKDDRPHHSSPGSPVVFTQQPALKDSTPHLPSPQLPNLSTPASNLVSSSPLSHSSNASSPVSVSQPPAPVVNLQALGKYVDKNLASHLSNWPTDLLDRQVWRSIMIHVKADLRMQTNNYYTFKACLPHKM